MIYTVSTCVFKASRTSEKEKWERLQILGTFPQTFAGIFFQKTHCRCFEDNYFCAVNIKLKIMEAIGKAKERSPKRIAEKNYRAELVGAFGCPIDENPTGVMEEAAFTAKNLFYRYLTIKVNKGDLGRAIDGVRAFNMKGINITIPHKVDVLQYLDELSEAASIIGAVNVIVNKEGRLWGENTDGKGYLTSLKNEGVSVAGKHIAILGAGGAARAISVECALAGAAKITIANIERDQGEELVNLLNTRTSVKAEFVPWDSPFQVPVDAGIFSNATSVGLFPHVNEKPNINYDTITSRMVVTDVIFNDPRTLFLGEAGKRGAKTINGLGMLVNQGALNFTLWTGVSAPVEVMEDALKREFGINML
jgi:shikimate dehydrogenase